jgi:hypothetical protein
MDWNAALEQEADIARRATKSIPRILQHPDLTPQRHDRLMTGISETRSRLETMRAQMIDKDAHSSFVAIASQLETIWAKLYSECSNRQTEAEAA